MNSTNSPRDNLEHIVADILNEVEECPVQDNKYQEEELMRSYSNRKDKIHNEPKAFADTIEGCFVTNGRSSSGSSSNGDSRDSGFDGLGSGTISTPSSSRRVTTSSDNLSTPPAMSAVSDGLSPSSEKINTFDFKALTDNLLEVSPLNCSKDSGYNAVRSTTMVNNESEKLIDLLMAKSLLTDDTNRSAFMNPEIFLSGKAHKYLTRFAPIRTHFVKSLMDLTRNTKNMFL